MTYSSISVITITNRKNCINNVINNFLRQNLENKELIIAINNNNLNINDYKNFIKKYDNIQIFKLDESISLGSCLNIATKYCKFPIIAKFDDDDYYGPFYLDEALNTFNTVDCQVVGKTKSYIYFEKYNKLTIYKLGNENTFVNAVLGSTLCFKKEILNKISFRDVNIREDKYFCRDCIRNQYRIYSTTLYNHIQFKHSNMNNHTFKYNLNLLMDLCSNVNDNLTFEDCFSLVDFPQIIL